jgi:polyferredoxin
MSDSSNDIPRGLVFRRLRRGSDHRARTLAFVSVVLVAGLALLWPVYPLVPSIEPYVLGLPFSFAWVVGWLVVVFGALVLLYRAEEQSSEEE